MTDLAEATRYAACALFIFCPLAGCKTQAARSTLDPTSTSAYESRSETLTTDLAPETVAPASCDRQFHNSPAYSLFDERDTDPFAEHETLEVVSLASEVLRRNPSVQAMVAAWRSAIVRYPRATSLDDPMIGVMLGPGSFGSDDVDFAWMVQGSQKIPWPGKRHLRGHIVQAEADAVEQDMRELRLRLVEAATMAFVEYYVALREIELNAQNRSKLDNLRAIAYANLVASKVGQGDVLDMEVQVQLLDQRQVELDRKRRIAVARINTLLHRNPEHRLPPPAELPQPRPLPPQDGLRRLAVERRPELASQAARIRAEEAAVELASREFYPDLEIVARYDAFWQGDDRQLAPQVGVNLNLPLQRERRRAAVEEAIQNVTRRRAEFQQRVAEIQNEVHAAAERLEIARAAIERYVAQPDGIIAKAELSAASAEAGYRASASDFLRLIDSQRQLIGYREKLVEAEAEYSRRLAELERAIGGSLPETPEH